MQRRIFVRHTSVTALLPWSASVVHAESALPKVTDFRALGRQQATKREPLVVLASLPGCPFCEHLRRSYLLPYGREGLMQSWQIDSTDATALIDFNGQVTTAQAWLQSRRVKTFPTLFFLNFEGADLVPWLVGGASSDFYGAYLDERLSSARRKLAV